MIQVSFNGRLGADPEVRQGKEGKEFIKFSVAVNEKRKGERTTTWMRVSSNNMSIAPYLKKGSLVFISGDEEVNTFIDKNGVTQVSRDVRANMIDFIPVGINNGENGNTDLRPVATTLPNTESSVDAMSMACGTLQPQGSVAQASDIDDLPF